MQRDEIYSLIEARLAKGGLREYGPVGPEGLIVSNESLVEWAAQAIAELEKRAPTEPEKPAYFWTCNLCGNSWQSESSVCPKCVPKRVAGRPEQGRGA